MGVMIHYSPSFNRLASFDTVVSRSDNLKKMLNLSSEDLKVLKECDENNFMQFEVDEEVFALSVRDISGSDCIVSTCLSNNSLIVSELWSRKITQKIETLKPIYSTYVHNKITLKSTPPS